jgi:hypothetical protein
LNLKASALLFPTCSNVALRLSPIHEASLSVGETYTDKKGLILPD